MIEETNVNNVEAGAEASSESTKQEVEITTELFQNYSESLEKLKNSTQDHELETYVALSSCRTKDKEGNFTGNTKLTGAIMGKTSNIARLLENLITTDPDIEKIMFEIFLKLTLAKLEK